MILPAQYISIQRQNGIHQQSMIEEHPKSFNQGLEEIKIQAHLVCSEIAAEMIKLKGRCNSKTFFLSIAHQFLERLIHLHCTEIKNMLSVQAKRLQENLHQDPQEAQVVPDMTLQELNKIKEKSGKEEILRQIEKLFSYLIQIECRGKTAFEKQNIFLEIKCSLNYTCPLCIKKMERESPKSSRLIESPGQKEFPQQHRTMKVISLIQPDRGQSRLPSLTKTSKFQSVLQSMKAERATAKKQSETKQKKLNMIWNLLNNLLELDRQRYVVDYIFTDHKCKQNRILKELQDKNNKNQRQISRFNRKMKTHHLQLKENKVTEEHFQNYQPPKNERPESIEKTNTRSMSSKSHRNVSGKKHVKILQPISNNRISNIQAKVTKNIIKRVEFCNEVQQKICTINLQNENPPVKNGITTSRQSKANHYYRPFKSNRDICQILPKYKCQEFDFTDINLNKSLKMI